MPDAALVRSRTPSRPVAKVKTGKSGRQLPKGEAPAWRFLRRHPGPITISVLSLVLMGGIVSNAVLMQKGHHPAPLFGRASPPEPPRKEAGVAPSEPEAVPPEPPARTSSLPASPPDEAPAPPVEAESPPAPPKRPPGARNVAAPPAKSTLVRKVDGIAKLLGGDASSHGEADVLAAQKALAKLGYRVAADGRMGTATRAALEEFAKSRHLKDGAELSPKLLRALAAAAHSAG